MKDKYQDAGKNEQHLNAYNRMMERVKAAYEEAAEEARPVLAHLIDDAKKKAVELGELTQEEAERIGTYLKRDLEDAADYLTSPEVKELVDWFKFDISLIEDRLLEMFTSVADQTKLELMQLEERARTANDYHTGEITGIGTLVCKACGEHLHFHASGHIPPCAKCHGTVFVRES